MFKKKCALRRRYVCVAGFTKHIAHGIDISCGGDKIPFTEKILGAKTIKTGDASTQPDGGKTVKRDPSLNLNVDRELF